jgi:hypothetical protein
MDVTKELAGAKAQAFRRMLQRHTRDCESAPPMMSTTTIWICTPIPPM